jgi:predicted nucleotidyltransferase
MKTIGIIAEYNPFHNGHALQFARIREQFGADTAIVVVMSGSFTQRGEPAVIDKWARTRMALTMGASLIIELPFAYATASAERFATGGVQCLLATGVVGQLVFGSESGDLAALERIASVLTDESLLFKTVLRQQLDLGRSFPAARQVAVAACLNDQSEVEACLKDQSEKEKDHCSMMLGTANNILAIEYLKALHRYGKGRIKPWTHQRMGQDYREADLSASQSLASATAIRRQIHDTYRDPAKMVMDLALHMPPTSLGILMEQMVQNRGPVFPENLAPTILTLLSNETAERIDRLVGMEEGLGRRLMKMACRPTKSTLDRLQDLLQAADTRRFPATRISRALAALLGGVTREDLALFDAAGGPQYLLGFDRKGRYLLKMLRQFATLPVMMKGSDLLELASPAAVRMAALDRLSTDLWSYAAGFPAGADFDTPVIMR